MKIASYNLRQGGSQQVHWERMIEDHLVDLLLVQESSAHDDHLPPLHFPNFRGQSVWERVEKNKWGSGVFSRNGALKPVSVQGFAGSVAGTEIAGASWQNGYCDPVFVFSVHAPAGTGGYQGQVNKLLDEIKKIAAGREVVIGGDFNLTVSNYPGSERPVIEQDLAIQARLTDEFRLINCWQAANPGQPLHQTLRWTRDRTTPYHCDGIFVPESWKDRLESCVVLSGDEWDRLSDHNPVVATFS